LENFHDNKMSGSVRTSTTKAAARPYTGRIRINEENDERGGHYTGTMHRDIALSGALVPSPLEGEG
jgi:hypothetical protein